MYDVNFKVELGGAFVPPPSLEIGFPCLYGVYAPSLPNFGTRHFPTLEQDYEINTVWYSNVLYVVFMSPS